MSVKEKEGTIKFDPSLVTYELSDKALEIMDTLKNNMFIISEVAQTRESYEEFITTLLNNMHYGFEHEEFRDCQVTYKFKNDPKEDVKWTTYRAFIVNTILWYPQVLIDIDKLDESYILSDYDAKHMTPGVQKKYIDTHYMVKYINLEGLSPIVHDANYFLAQISKRFNRFMGISININTFRDLEKRIPEYGDIMRNFKVDESKQPAEIEREIQEASKRQTQLILEDKVFNTLKAIIQPGAVKEKQLSEIQTLIGLKPNEQGQTMTKPINTKYVIEGLNNIFSLYVESVSGRTAAIINKTLMGDAGHMLILVAIMTSSAKLKQTPTDCGGANLLPIEVTDKNVLKKINMRKYKLAGMKKFKTINCEEDDNLIGQTIWMRSPVTCGCKDHVCKECYGDLWYINRDLNSAGAYAAFITINPVVQGLLSAKHHQGTNSDMIVFNEGFDKYFMIDSTDIIIKNDIESVESYSLIIRLEDMEVANDDGEGDIDVSSITGMTTKKKRKKSSESDEPTINDDDGGSVIGLSYFTKKFYVAKNYGSKKNQTLECFEDVDHKDLYMHQDFLSRMTAVDDPELGKILVLGFEDIDMSEFVFVIELQNNGVTKPMKETEKLLSNKYHENCDTYEAMVNKMISLLIASGINVQSVHAEMIIRQLIRKSSNRLKRPDFSKIVMRQDYEIMTINSALKYSPSLATSLNTSFLKYQLITMIETEEKTESSDFDQIFARTLNLDEMVKHSGGRMDFK